MSGVLSGLIGSLVSGTFELIESRILTTTATSVTFSNLGDFASTYKHLQIRHVTRCNNNAGAVATFLRINGDSGTNYGAHYLFAAGAAPIAVSSTSANEILYGTTFGLVGSSSAYATGVIDILDAYSTTKNKTIRSLDGRPAEAITMASGFRINNASTTSITLLLSAASFTAGSRFSIYGIR
jgi:hypothetical protein